MAENIYHCELCHKLIGADDNPVYENFAEDYPEYGGVGHIWLCGDCVHNKAEFGD